MIKKLFIFSIVLFLFNNTGFSQLADGEIAPNWTLIDINDSTHTLYDYLDQGYSVVIDVSAVWCGPCWSYHNTHALKDVYENHGPSGFPGVDAGTTDDMMVFFVEGDSQSNLDCLNGITSGCNHPYGTLGDWVTGTPYPIINSTAINNSYDINYFPTVYLICPDRVIKEIGQLTAANIYIEAQQCPVLSTNINDAKAFEIIDPAEDYCTGIVTPKVKIQNYGTSLLTSLDIYSLVDAVVIDTFNWTGNLNMYEVEQITLNDITVLIDGNHVFEFSINNPNGVSDEDTGNDDLNSNFSTNSLGTEITIKVKTDDYPSQTSWDIKLGTTVVASGGNFEDENHIYIDYACLFEDSCYTFTVYDSGNNGLGGNSFGLIMWNSSTIVSFGASVFNDDQISLDFCLTVSGIEKIKNDNLNIYPNPAQNVVYIDFDNKKSNSNLVQISNIYGKIIFNKEIKNTNDKYLEIDVSNYAKGIYNVVIKNEVGIYSKKFIVL